MKKPRPVELRDNDPEAQRRRFEDLARRLFRVPKKELMAEGIHKKASREEHEAANP